MAEMSCRDRGALHLLFPYQQSSRPFSGRAFLMIWKEVKVIA